MTRFFKGSQNTSAIGEAEEFEKKFPMPYDNKNKPFNMSLTPAYISPWSHTRFYFFDREVDVWKDR